MVLRESCSSTEGASDAPPILATATGVHTSIGLRACYAKPGTDTRGGRSNGESNSNGPLSGGSNKNGPGSKPNSSSVVCAYAATRGEATTAGAVRYGRTRVLCTLVLVLTFIYAPTRSAFPMLEGAQRVRSDGQASDHASGAVVQTPTPSLCLCCYKLAVRPCRHTRAYAATHTGSKGSVLAWLCCYALWYKGGVLSCHVLVQKGTPTSSAAFSTGGHAHTHGAASHEQVPYCPTVSSYVAATRCPVLWWSMCYAAATRWESARVGEAEAHAQVGRSRYRATRSFVLGLRMCYAAEAACGTEMAYGAMRCPSANSVGSRYGPLFSYAMSDTGVAYAATRPISQGGIVIAHAGTEIAHAGTEIAYDARGTNDGDDFTRSRDLSPYSASGTDISVVWYRAPTPCPVLRVVLPCHCAMSGTDISIAVQNVDRTWVATL
eukprot:2087453-Rhodomonas_salina.3